MFLLLDNKHWLLYYLLGFFIDLLGVFFLYEEKWMLFCSLPALMLMNLLMAYTSNVINKLFLNYAMVLLELGFICAYGLICHKSLVNLFSIQRLLWINFGFMYRFLLKIIIQLRSRSNKLSSLKGNVFIKNPFLNHLFSNSSVKITDDITKANTVIIENTQEYDPGLMKHKTIISLDSNADLLSKYKHHSSIEVNTDLKHMNIVIITNDEQIILNCRKIFNHSTIITDNEYLATKYNCSLYSKNLISNLDTPQDIIMDFYMLNMHNMKEYSHIMQDLYKHNRMQKILLCASRYSSSIDILVPNIMKEILWLKLMDKQQHNIVVPVRFGDIISDYNFGIFNELNNMDNIVLNHNIICTDINSIIKDSIHLIENISDFQGLRGVFSSPSSKIVPTEAIMNLYSNYHNHIEYQALWSKISEVETFDEKLSLNIYNFPWLNRAEPIMDKFLHSEEFNAIEILNLMFNNI